MIQSSTSGAPFDATFVLWLFGMMGIGVVLAILGFAITGALVFYSRDATCIKAYAELFSKGDVLRLLTVSGILVIVLALTFARFIEGAAAASILSGVAGYVLGGMSRRPSPSLSEGTQRNIVRPAAGGLQEK